MWRQDNATFALGFLVVGTAALKKQAQMAFAGRRLNEYERTVQGQVVEKCAHLPCTA